MCCRSLLSDPVSTLPSPSAKRPSREHTVDRDAVTVSSPGTSHLLASGLGLISVIRILRAFLVEEAKIVKKVIKSQAKPARK